LKSEEQYIEELKASIEKDQGRTITQEEATQAYQLIKLLAEISVENIFKESDRQKKLKDNPKGFHLEEGGTCGICGEYAKSENAWYDKNGIKCISCQKAIDKKIIPISVIKNKDSWYSKYELESYFNITRHDLNRYVKQGILKKRVVSLDEKRTHLDLFLISDNKNVLPPKKLLTSKIIKFEKDGEQYYTRAEWYECIDERGAKNF
jgi:hypothetical protein